MNAARRFTFRHKHQLLLTISLLSLFLCGGCNDQATTVATPDTLAREFLQSWLDGLSTEEGVATIEWTSGPSSNENAQIQCVDGNVYYTGWQGFLPLKKWNIESSEVTEKGAIFRVRIPDKNETQVPFSFEVIKSGESFRIGKAYYLSRWVDATP